MIKKKKADSESVFMLRSLRSKVTLLTIIPLTVALLITSAIGTALLRNFGHEHAEQTLSLLCQTGKNNLNYYFKSVEQSVDIVSKLMDDQLDTIPDDSFNTYFSLHVKEAERIFMEAAIETNGVFTFYYRFDPEITDKTGEPGFWYVKNGNVFESHEVTDISDDRNECVWFYTPKDTGKPIWLPPYVTDNLNEYVLSYNAPVYRKGSFVGVVGIEIDYKTLGEQIKDIKALDSGYAFIVENVRGTIIYHPHIDLLGMKEEDRPLTPPEFTEGLLAGKNHIEYRFEGVEKHCYLMPLSNGMSVVVTATTDAINGIWLRFVLQIVVASILIVVAAILAAVIFARRITKPLKELTLAAEEISRGNYDVKLEHRTDDEIGTLTKTVNQLVDNLGGYIEDLNQLAYADSLTSVRNRSAFDVAMKELQRQVEAGEHPDFAIAMFDCDNLKEINDEFGHDKGNVYLRNACNLICRVFAHSVVYRIGGDEFVSILIGEDYQNKEALLATFKKKVADVAAFAKEAWERTSVSSGIAAYDPQVDHSVDDVLTHADHLMYADKRARKKRKVKS